jgi:hypothetical protein
VGDAAAQQRRQVLGDVGVAGLAGQHGWGQAVDVGPGSTPGLSKVYIECPIAPSAVTVSAATLITRAAAASKPRRSPTSRRRRPRSPLRCSFLQHRGLHRQEREIGWRAANYRPITKHRGNDGRDARLVVALRSELSGPVDCYQIVTGELSYFPLPSFVTLARRAVGILVCTPPLRGRKRQSSRRTTWG